MIDLVQPYFVKAETLIRSLSSIFLNKNKKIIQITNTNTNTNNLPGFMDHDPKKEAESNHLPLKNKLF
jgi:hypothetical protein